MRTTGGACDSRHRDAGSRAGGSQLVQPKRGASHRGLAIAVVLGLIFTLAGTESALAKTTKKCAKGFVRNKARKCVRKAAATTKKVTATTKPSTAGTAAPTAKPVAKGTVKIGVLGNEVNARGQVLTPEAKQISKVWADTMNAAGGINGYKIDLEYRSVQGDPARALNAIKELDKDGIIAFTQGDASIMPALRDFMTQKSLPVVGGTPYTNEYDWHSMFFQTEPGQAEGVYGQVAAARDVGAKYFENFYCIDVAACATSVAETKYAAEREGLKFRAESGGITQPDLTAACITAKNAGVDFFQANGPPLANIVRDCARQNFHPTYAQGGAANQAVIDAAKGENVAGNLYEFGIFYNGPEVQRFRQALARTDQRADDGTATQTSVQVWLGLEGIGAVLKRMTQADPTRQDFLNTIYTIKSENLGGQIAPIDWSVQKPGTGRHATSDCWTEHIVKDGKLYQMNTHGQIATKLTFICGTGFTLNDKQSPM